MSIHRWKSLAPTPSYWVGGQDLNSWQSDSKDQIFNYTNIGHEVANLSMDTKGMCPTSWFPVPTIWGQAVKAFFNCTKQGIKHRDQGALRGMEGSPQGLSAISCHLLLHFFCIPSKSSQGPSCHVWELDWSRRGQLSWRCNNFTHPKGFSALKES